jgi:hypothetical protein
MNVLPKGGNVFEIDIRLPGRAVESPAAVTPYRLKLQASSGKLGL